MKEIFSQGSRQEEGVVVESGFINALKAGILSAINGQKESHNR